MARGQFPAAATRYCRALANFSQTAKKGKKKKTTASAGSGGKAGSTFAAATGQPAPASATTTATETQVASQQPEQRAGYSAPRVEELDDDEE